MGRKQIVIDVKEKMSFITFIKGIWDFVSKYALMLLNVGIIILVFMLFRWAGLKGLVMFILGLIVMALLLLSKNPMLKWAIDMTKSEWFIDEVKNEEKEK